MDTGTQEKQSCEDRGRDWSDAAMSITNNQQNLGEARPSTWVLKFPERYKSQAEEKQ